MSSICPKGPIKERTDYLSYQFWSDEFTGQDETITMDDGLAQVTVTQGGNPLQGVPVYLFKPPSSYLGKSATTDPNGQVIFNLPEKSYKVRADQLGYQFWSGEFVWADTTVTIENGIARIHVHRSGSPVVGARVYLFKGSGGYLGQYADTDDQGNAEFGLPDRQYKFRVDWEGAQYWSDPITIIPHEVNEVDMDLDLLGLDLTKQRLYAHNNPEKIQLAMVGFPYGLFVRSVIAAPSVSESIYYYHNDHLGTPQVLTDDNGEVVWKADYKPFGEADVVVEDVGNNFRFPGQYYDEETGLHYNYHRYYHSDIGRYLRTDPIDVISDGVSQDGPNHLYIYVGNNPVNWIDPWGEVACNYSITGKMISCIYKDPITCGDLLISCYAESGNNNPDDQCTKNVGPIPTGRWNIGVPDSRGRAWLDPLPGTNTCNPPRTDLQIHGWGTTEGCIAIKLNSCRDIIMRALREEGGGYLEVTR